MNYFIELPGKWPKSRPRLLQIIGWAVAELDDDYSPPRETWYQGGGIPLPEDAYTDGGTLFTGQVPKFVYNGLYAAIFPSKETAEDMALKLVAKYPAELSGRLYLSAVTRLGVLTKEAKLCQKAKRP